MDNLIHQFLRHHNSKPAPGAIQFCNGPPEDEPDCRRDWRRRGDLIKAEPRSDLRYDRKPYGLLEHTRRPDTFSGKASAMLHQGEQYLAECHADLFPFIVSQVRNFLHKAQLAIGGPHLAAHL
jgi:hypothetical protein